MCMQYVPQCTLKNTTIYHLKQLMCTCMLKSAGASRGLGSKHTRGPAIPLRLSIIFSNVVCSVVPSTCHLVEI